MLLETSSCISFLQFHVENKLHVRPHTLKKRMCLKRTKDEIGINPHDIEQVTCLYHVSLSDSFSILCIYVYQFLIHLACCVYMFINI